MYILKNQQTFGDQDLKSTIIYKNHIITVGRSPNIYIYNPDTKETITINTNFSSISSAILFGDSLILGTQIGTILIYNNILENTIPMYLAGHTQSVCSLDAYEHFLLSSSWDGSIRLWDLLNYRQLSIFSVDCCVWQARFFKLKINGYNAIDFYCACANKSVLLYKNKEMYKSIVFHLTAVRGVLLHNDSVYSIGNDGKIMKSNIDGKLLKVTDIKEFLYCLTIDNDKVYVCGENGIVVICDLDLNIIWKTKTEIQSCWNVNVNDNKIYISGSCGNSLIFEEGDEPELVEDNSSHKLKDKNYKVMNGKVYYLVNDKWTLVGDVVEQNYDHTFSVEVDGKFLKICFNENDDVYNVADKFLLENNLNKNYRDDIVEFIRKNYTPKQALFMYKDINLEGVKKYLKDEVIIENLENLDNKNSKEVEERLKKLLDEENNFYVLDCYRYLYAHDYEFDFTFLQDYKVNDKKSGTVFLRLVCNMYKNLPYNMSILKSKIDKIIDMKFADDRTIANYTKNKDISDK